MTRSCLVLWIFVLLSGCAQNSTRETAAETPREESVTPPLREQDSRPVIVAFGDSLTAGFGLNPGLSFPDFLQKDLDRKGLKYRVVNQGISGDTTDGGVSRVDSAIALKPRVVILELGANDGLRGLPVSATRANLAQMIDAFQGAGAQVLLCGMTLPRNYGASYIKSFENIFIDLAREKKTALVPFFLEGVATKRDLMQGDALHPTAQGNARVAQNVMQHLEPLLNE